jgi:hypothetical protein
MISDKPVDKVDVEELIREFKVINIDTFATYLKEVWKVLINLTSGSLTTKRRYQE